MWYNWWRQWFTNCAFCSFRITEIRNDHSQVKYLKLMYMCMSLFSASNVAFFAILHSHQVENTRLALVSLTSWFLPYYTVSNITIIIIEGLTIINNGVCDDWYQIFSNFQKIIQKRQLVLARKRMPCIYCWRIC